MQFSTDQQHAATLHFLAEVRDYLARWPPHPMNREMIQRIEAHLAEPTRKLVRQQSYTRSGGAYTPMGMGIVQVSVTGELATVSLLPDAVSAPEKIILRALRRSQEVILKVDAT
ncbi:hypothetical protein EJP67_33315 [Variovorax guangxiensis]|uniref:Uncharacterized protein n=1 Tax=Variovorax guangxiensis TaxID=1775474 RepID=A0A433MVU0_9BURK|nr:hypothetical protein [Variovorax guangxiensis]RUR71938.1 hypothetical protein EJP67_33315 [Variovorax guangxiensis]